MSSALIIPYCTGMERSGSRVTWQIVKHLSPSEPPAGWYPEYHSAIYDFHVAETETRAPRQFINWPMRSHDYYPDLPVIYTFRNPIEAFLSLYSRQIQDVGQNVPGPTGKKLESVPGVWIDEMSIKTPIMITKDIAAQRSLIAIGKQWDYWKRYKEEQASGRVVLFLKYEDHFANHMSRVEMIADFMNSSASKAELWEVGEETSLEKNLKISSSIEKNNPNALFGQGFLGETGLQRGHVNPNIKGMPGLHIQAQPRIFNKIRTANSGALQALREMTEDMGYEL